MDGEQTIEIVIGGGKFGDNDSSATVSATVIGPLAVHRMHSGYADLNDGRSLWTITHIETGYAICHKLSSESLAKQIAQRLNDRDVWTGLSRHTETTNNRQASEWFRQVLNEFSKTR